MNNRELLDIAIEAKEKAYAPYSNVKVGAALLTKEGKVFTGCNVENASFGATNCAERTAIFKAISEGYQSFEKIAVACSLEHAISPCGICRQVILEFGPHIEVIFGDAKEYKSFKISELVPESFTKEELEG